MFDFIKSTYKKGDKLKITCVQGVFSGEIILMSDDSIILKSPEGKPFGIKGSEISFFEELSKSAHDVKDTSIVVPTVSSVNEIPSTEKSNGNNDLSVEQKANPTCSTEKIEPNTDRTDVAVPGQPQLKIVGKIDLDAVNQRYRPKKSKKNKNKETPADISHNQEISSDSVDNENTSLSQEVAPPSKKQSKPTLTLHGLDALRALSEDMRQQENEKLVPAIGHIKFVIPERNYGFITDAKSGSDFYFRIEQLVDNRIVDKSPIYLEGLPVIYSIQKNARGDVAGSIHRPGKISELITLAQDLAEKGDTKHSLNVLEHIFDEYPDNNSARELQKKLRKEKRRAYLKSSVAKSDTVLGNYDQAKKYAQAKEYQSAIDYYIKAINNNERLESSIKDLGMLYAQLYKMGGDEANIYKDYVIELIDTYRKDLPNSISTLYYLENLFYSVQDYDSFIKVARELLSRKELIRDKSRSSILLSKIAAAYVRKDDLENAMLAINEALKCDPNNTGAKSIKEALQNEDNAKEVIEEISATEFDSLNSGFSLFIQQTLEEYDEYIGVPPKIIESGQFNKRTLQGIRKQIESAGALRPRESAQYLLTEGKLMLLIEPNDENRLRSVMARYCKAMALSHISNYSSMDITRFFYNEAFSLEQSFVNNTKQVALYLLSNCSTASELLNLTTSKNLLIEEALAKAVSSDRDKRSWESILTMFIYNPEISAHIVSLLFTKAELRKKAIQALHYFDPSNESKEYKKEQFIEAWNNVRDKRIRDYNQALASIKSIKDSNSIDEFIILLSGLNDVRKEWMTALDTSRIRTIINNILPTLQLYVKSSGYRNKESNRSNANNQILQLKDEISDGPTKLSFEGLLPLLEKGLFLLESSFQEVLVMSEPKIDISLLSEATVINEDDTITVQVSISNHQDSSPIREVEIELGKSEDIVFVKSDRSYNMLEGGDSQIFKLQFKVSDNVVSQKAAALPIICNYKSGEGRRQTSSLLSLKLYSQNDFKRIENPYAPYADGGPMKSDSNMFFGREEEIKNVVDAIINSPSKQIIIYGQKRSGKSSVLNRIKKSLQDTGKAFCVSFSLGEILQNLDEVSFYHRILYSIKQELRDLEIDGEKNVPTFVVPTKKEFKEEDEDNPLNTFTNYMIEFKHQCKLTEGWKDKLLVIMIDEFTYLYSGIKKGEISKSIMKQWKAVTQNERAQFSVVLVGQDVVPSFKKEDYARNAFGVIQDMRLTYLKDEPARELIETPILDDKGNSRYIGNAVSRIIDYTSRNPYYIQIFCSRLVDFMNRNKSISVTEADVNEVARSFISGSEALEEDKFDNLIRAGESEDLQEYSEADIMEVLRQIAVNSKNLGYCNRDDVDVLDDKDLENAIIKDLCDREVLEIKGENKFKIQVKLFQEWLLKHC
jgi:tetratricopeptide (TPR) repeat protein